MTGHNCNYLAPIRPSAAHGSRALAPLQAMAGVRRSGWRTVCVLLVVAAAAGAGVTAVSAAGGEGNGGWKPATAAERRVLSLPGGRCDIDRRESLSEAEFLAEYHLKKPVILAGGSAADRSWSVALPHARPPGCLLAYLFARALPPTGTDLHSYAPAAFLSTRVWPPCVRVCMCPCMCVGQLYARLVCPQLQVGQRLHPAPLW